MNHPEVEAYQAFFDSPDRRRELKTLRPALFDEKLLMNHCIAHRVSYLCAMFLACDQPLTVCKDASGYYIGADDPVTGTPLARDSHEYWIFAEPAALALRDFSWTQRLEQ